MKTRRSNEINKIDPDKIIRQCYARKLNELNLEYLENKVTSLKWMAEEFDPEGEDVDLITRISIWEDELNELREQMR